ncbi:mannose-6-phosphate isomerase 1 [Panicum miliaceum]|uniref:Mannose-6-phosphate isomerase 1 n=1 Tax=Panicum miliaceum TaxID=4540 RepID=A0A3L6PPX6_PANMI|nr:mannose-6-phosphate isomerase 1 [Panicum miliaceum]
MEHRFHLPHWSQRPRRRRTCSATWSRLLRRRRRGYCGCIARGAVQHYEWGWRGAASLVARFTNQDPDLARPYAQLWMGTHPSGPSTLLDDGELLRDWLMQKPDALGPAVAAWWGGQLAFLLKVLSVAKALSIKAHPDKKLAEALHALRPSIYKDDNHKPETAIAITEFRVLYGFAGMEELKDVLRTVPEVEKG